MLWCNVDKKLDELLKENITEEVPSSPTEWVSLLVLEPKRDGDICICIDTQKSNYLWMWNSGT